MKKSIIVVVFIFFSCHNNYSKFDIRYDNEIVHVFLSDPLSQKYISNKNWEHELLQQKSKIKYDDNISLIEYGISKSKELEMPYKIIVYRNNNNFYHIFPLMDEFYYLFGGYTYNQKKIDESCISYVSETMYQNVSLERHLNYIIRNDPYFKKSVDSVDLVKMKNFINYFMINIVGCKQMIKETCKITLKDQYDSFYKKNDFKKEQLRNINENYKRIIENIGSYNIFYYVNKQTVYELKMGATEENPIILTLLNKEWFYYALW